MIGEQSSLCYMVLTSFCLLNSYYVPGTILGAGAKTTTQTGHPLSHKRSLTHLIFRTSM